MKLGKVGVEAERDPAGAERHAGREEVRHLPAVRASCSRGPTRYRRLGVRANADLPDQAELAYAFGARGIGLCRTEHMFFGEGRIPIVQRMILADNEADRRKALNELLPLQRDDFYGVFKGDARLAGDHPHHRSAAPRVPAQARGPDGRRGAARGAAARRGAELDEKRRLLARVEQLHEFNPMLGHRGVRLGITYPEITEMQTRAIIEAACRLNKEGIEGRARDHDPARRPREGAERSEGDRRSRRRRGDEGAGRQDQVPGRHDDRGAARLRSPPTRSRAEAQFFSFGTNDLTQLAYGFSRDDVGKFLRIYQEKKILDKDPFASIDTEGVGALVRDRRRARPQDPARPEDRDLRRARRRPGVDPLLPQGRPRLRQRVALPCPGGAARGGAGRARRSEVWRLTAMT